MRKGLTRSSYAMMRQTGGDSDGISQKPSKKLKKLSSVGETYQSTSNKRVKLPIKFFDECHMLNQSSVPRKLRSATKKRQVEYVTPSLGNGTRRSETPSNDRNKKLKVETDERQHSTMSESITEQITEDEKDVMAALLAIAGIVPENNNANKINLKIETSEAEATSLQEKYELKPTVTVSKSNNLVQNHEEFQDLNEVTNTLDVKKVYEDFSDRTKSQKRCVLHAYICRIIKDLQVTEGKRVNSHKETKPMDYADAKANTMRETITNGTKNANKTLWQDISMEVCSDSVEKNHKGVPITHRLDSASKQVAMHPYFGSPLYDPSQWSRPVFPKQQMSINPFVPGSRYQNGGHETVLPPSGSYIGTSSGSKKDARNMPHQLQYSMQFGSSGYEEYRGSFFVESSPTLKLTL